MKKQISIGMFGFGKTGKEVVNQFLQDPEVELCWIVRGSHTAEDERNCEDTPVYVAKEIDILKLLNSQPVDFIVDFSNSDTCMTYAPIAAKLKIGIVSAVSVYEEHQLELLKNTSKYTAVLYSPNITLGINFIIIAGKILRKLAPHAGVEVIEEHFHNKKEVSGTAIRIAELLELDPAQAAIFSRPARAAKILRPPGALPEKEFDSTCIRCGLCVKDCPYDILKLASWADPAPLGTPFFVARENPCRMCKDIPCVKACPTGALDPLLTDIKKADMGVAVLVDHENCLNYKGLTCSVCVRVCPIRGEAISLKPIQNERGLLQIPTVNPDKCTGCGTCEKHCVLSEATIRVLPRELGLGISGTNAMGRNVWR